MGSPALTPQTTELELREAQQHDAELLWRWANDPATREASFSPDPIPWDDHVRWFASVLDDPDRILLLAERDGVPVGQIRFDREDDHAYEVAVSVAPEHRSTGLSAPLIDTGVQWLAGTAPGNAVRVRARIKSWNAASRAAFRRAGFIPNPESTADHEVLVRVEGASGRLVLGSAQWGAEYGVANRTGPPSAAELRDMLRVAADRGVHTIDTARSYAGAEEAIGRAIADVPGWWRVVTKVRADLPVDGRAAECVQAVRESVEASRQALGQAPLGGVLLHRTQHTTTPAWGALLQLQEEGRVGCVGVSVSSAHDAEEVLGKVPALQMLQVPASLLDRRAERAGIFERAREVGIEVHVRSAFLQGALFLDPAALPAHLLPLRDVLAALRAFANERGTSLEALALGHLRALSAVRVVIGTETEAQLRANVAAWAAPELVADDVREAREIVGELPDAVLDPARWPTRPPGQ